MERVIERGIQRKGRRVGKGEWRGQPRLRGYSKRYREIVKCGVRWSERIE